MRQVTHALLTRPPLTSQPLWRISKISGPFDLHVLGTPPAFILSQDQTLSIISSKSCYTLRLHIDFNLISSSLFPNVGFRFFTNQLSFFRSLLCFRRFLFFWNLRGLCINSLLVFIVLLSRWQPIYYTTLKTLCQELFLKAFCHSSRNPLFLAVSAVHLFISFLLPAASLLILSYLSTLRKYFFILFVIFLSYSLFYCHYKYLVCKVFDYTLKVS